MCFETACKKIYGEKVTKVGGCGVRVWLGPPSMPSFWLLTTDHGQRTKDNGPRTDLSELYADQEFGDEEIEDQDHHGGGDHGLGG